MRRELAKVQPRGLASRSCLGRRRNYAQQSRAGWWGERPHRTVAPGKEGSELGGRRIIWTFTTKAISSRGTGLKG